MVNKMTHNRFIYIRDAIAVLTDQFKREAQDVHTDSWQGVRIGHRPEAAMKELLNVTLAFEVGDRTPAILAQATGCNMPWAEDHFQERVCGAPINPGIQWEKWPWGNSADAFRKRTVRTMAPEDWAYLAGIIDGEGSFSVRTCNGVKAYPRIKITQADREFLETLFKKWSVGTLREYSNDGNKLSDRPSWIWRISSKSEVRWLLDGCLPYLRLKKARAGELRDYLDPEETVYDEEPKFNHNYMQRYWPKYAGRDEEAVHRGIYHEYGDLNDVVDLLGRDPLTRQAYLPVFFPEDTGAVHGNRVPCTLGYHFIVRNDELHCVYYLRSCDFVRHFRDDVYLSVRLQQWVLEQLREQHGERWASVRPGSFTMHITSLHCFINDFRSL